MDTIVISTNITTITINLLTSIDYRIMNVMNYGQLNSTIVTSARVYVKIYWRVTIVMSMNCTSTVIIIMVTIRLS